MNSHNSILKALLIGATLFGVQSLSLAGGGNDEEIPYTAVIKKTPGVGYGVVNNALKPLCDNIHYTGAAWDDTVRVLTYELENGATAAQVHATLQSLVAQGLIEFGESNFGAHTVGGQTGSIWVTDLGVTAWVFSHQYASQLLGFPAAHLRSRGEGVVVAVVDSGIDSTHVAVQGPLAIWQWDFVENDADPTDVGDTIDNDNDGFVDDGVGHGTFVTSLIRLAAPAARLMHLRVLDDEGNSNTFLLSQAIHSAIDHGAHIINVSASTDFNSSVLADAVARAKAAGIIVVAAAGNDGLPTPSSMEYPAGFSDAVSVCATDHLDIKGAFSNYGRLTDFASPGVSFVSSVGALDPTTSILGAIPGAGYAHWSGTSLSAAFLAGSAALVRAQYPAWPNESVPASAIVGTVVGLLAQSATPIDANNPQYAGLLGVGRVNAAGAVLLGPPVPSIADINGDFVVNGLDLAMVLSAWGTCGTTNCAEDFDGNGAVDGADLSLLMANWG